MKRFSLMALGIPMFLLLSIAQGARGNPTYPRRPIIIERSKEDLEKLSSQRKDLVPVGTLFFQGRGNSDSIAWMFIGPKPIIDEYWSQGNASGRVTAIAIHPDNPSIVYVGGAQGGVWKTSDGGQNWEPLTDQLSSLATGSIALDPNNPDVIYYGTGEQHFCGDCFYGDGLFKSTDGGETWEKIAGTSSVGKYISKILVDPRDSLLLHLTSDRGYLRSTDGGVTWTCKIATDWGTDLVMRADSPSVVLAAIYDIGIYKSVDAGESWTLIGGGLPSDGFRRINMAISLSNPDIIYASFISDTGTLYGMYKSTDGGDSWFLLPNTPNYPGGQGWYDNCLVVDPSDPLVAYAGGVFPYGASYYGLIKTTDGGETWTDITIGSDGSQLHPDQHALAIGSDGTLWVANDGGVWKSTDAGDTWINLNGSLGVTQFYTVALDPSDSSFILGGTQDNGTVYYSGSIEWYQQNAGDGGPSVFEWDSPNIYYTTYVLLSIIFKWNNGNYLGDVHGPWGGDRVSWCNAPLITDPNLPNTLLAGTHRVWKSENSGGSWTDISGDLTYGGGHLRAIVVAQGNSEIIYTGSSDGRVFLTMDGGSTWQERNNALFEGHTISDMWISPYDWKTLYLSVDRSSVGRVYLTTDSAHTWENKTGDLPSGIRGMSMAVDFGTTPPLLFLGTDYGMYVSFNNGENWVKQDGNFPNVAVYDIALDTLNDVVIAATHGRGMWRAETATGVKEVASKRGNLSLNIYPNPAEDLFLLKYSVPGKDPVRIGIFDSRGGRVGKLARGSVLGGEIEWTTGNLKAGVFFVTLEGKGFKLTRKLVVVK